MHYTILDCYTDEASGLGVPPYLGTYPRYLYAKLKNEGHTVSYLTIDDLRFWKYYKKIPKQQMKTNIKIYNRTFNDAEPVLKNTNVLITIIGVHVPGKYLSALPGTLREVIPLIKELPIKKKILTGPAILGTQLEGGKKFEKYDLSFAQLKDFSFTFDEIEKFSLSGADILDQIPDRRMIEIETGRGCKVGSCSFCTEPLKSKFINRKMENVVCEIEAYYKKGARFFRLGKQADFYASDRPVEMLKQIRDKCPGIKVLHIDNVNPNSVITQEGIEITKGIVKYCTEGNIAAFGVESFDPNVIKANRLNTSPYVANKAIEIINKYGAVRGKNGMHKFLPGINLIFGLLKESKKTHEYNMQALNKIMKDKLLLRRINIRQVAVLPGTFIEENGGLKYLKKNKRYYWKWRDQIRQEIDWPMLIRLVPIGTVLENVYTEIYDGNTTFCRQMGSYPLTIGVKGRLPLKKKIKVKVISHMLRSITAELLE